MMHASAHAVACIWGEPGRASLVPEGRAGRADQGVQQEANEAECVHGIKLPVVQRYLRYRQAVEVGSVVRTMITIALRP